MAPGADLERDELSLLADAASALGEWPEQEPPADGLERVLTAIAAARPLRPRSEEWLRPVLLSGAGVLAGGLLICALATQLALPAATQAAAFGPVRALSAFGVAALVFFGGGSLVTLALAPMLILELKWRPQGALGR